MGRDYAQSVLDHQPVFPAYVYVYGRGRVCVFAVLGRPSAKAPQIIWRRCDQILSASERPSAGARPRGERKCGQISSIPGRPFAMARPITLRFRSQILSLPARLFAKALAWGPPLCGQILSALGRPSARARSRIGRCCDQSLFAELPYSLPRLAPF